MQQPHVAMGGGTTHTPVMGHHGSMMMQPGMATGQSVQQLQPNWMSQQPRGHVAQSGGTQNFISNLNQSRANQPNQYTPNPVSICGIILFYYSFHLTYSTNAEIGKKCTPVKSRYIA